MPDMEINAYVFWGASGHARVLAEMVHADGAKLIALFENDIKKISPFSAVPVYYGRDGFERFVGEMDDLHSIGALSAIGGGRGRDRLAQLEIFDRAGFYTGALVHKAAHVASTASVGKSCQVLVEATICTDAVIGDATIVNTSAIVDHECVLGGGVHIGPGATLCGCVVVEENVFVGAGAVVLPRLTVGADAVIGAGAVVTKSVPAGDVVVGNPARSLND